MRDSKSLIEGRVAIEPQALSSTTDVVGEIIDRQGFESVLFALITDAIAVGSLVAQLLIEEGDAANLSDAADVADADLLGTEADTAIDENDDKVTKTIGYRGEKRYVRATLTVTTNAGTDVIGATALLSHAHNQPVA